MKDMGFYGLCPDLLAELLAGERESQLFVHKQVTAIRPRETTWENTLYSLSYSITRPANREGPEEATQLNSTLGIEIVSG